MSSSRGACGPFTLAVCSEMVFRDLPVADRVRRLTELDVQVEIWDWTSTTSMLSWRCATRGWSSPR